MTECESESGLGGSRFLKTCFGVKQGPVPQLDLEFEIEVQNIVRGLIQAGLLRSAHDCSEGGLAVALAECCFNPAGLLGATIHLPPPANGSTESVIVSLFNEAQSRIVISVAPDNLDRVTKMLGDRNVPFQQIGKVIDQQLAIRVGQTEFSWPTTVLYDDWWNSIRRAVEQDESIPSL
jgi:phosphoribosylformylglycinamidine synthase